MHFYVKVVLEDLVTKGNKEAAQSVIDTAMPFASPDVQEFLKNKPGYTKEGGKRLRNHLSNKGFATTIKKCKIALREVRAENKEVEEA